MLSANTSTIISRYERSRSVVEEIKEDLADGEQEMHEAERALREELKHRGTVIVHGTHCYWFDAKQPLEVVRRVCEQAVETIPLSEIDAVDECQPATLSDDPLIESAWQEALRDEITGSLRLKCECRDGLDDEEIARTMASKFSVS